MKELSQARSPETAVLPPPTGPASELGRELLAAWQRVDALREAPLTLGELQREALEDAEFKR